MDHARPNETQQSKSSMLQHSWEHMEESAGDERPSEVSVKSATEDEMRPFRRVRSPPRPRAGGSSSFKPRFRGRFFRPRFLKDDRPFRKPGFGFQRYHHHFTPQPRFPHGDNTDPKMTLAQREREKQRQREKAKGRGEHRENVDTGCPPKDCSTTLGSVFPRSSSSREKDKLPFSFNVSQENEGSRSREKDREGALSKERDRGGDRELPSTVSRDPAARNRAIQQKRREIEEIYHQDCDMFGAVVRMLIAKDPSLERLIQSSLQENLGDIGMRCVEAMQQFIEEYDSREVSS